MSEKTVATTRHVPCNEYHHRQNFIPFLGGGFDMLITLLVNTATNVPADESSAAYELAGMVVGVAIVATVVYIAVKVFRKDHSGSGQRQSRAQRKNHRR